MLWLLILGIGHHPATVAHNQPSEGMPYLHMEMKAPVLCMLIGIAAWCKEEGEWYAQTTPAPDHQVQPVVSDHQSHTET
jgi:hypothetical protein